ncbi:MAG TPA: hypothetical protein PK093_21060 [Phycisphaerae bacterium]|nr:hypothetical protein [Phycisphaerae bacterium]
MSWWNVQTQQLPELRRFRDRESAEKALRVAKGSRHRLLEGVGAPAVMIVVIFLYANFIEPRTGLSPDVAPYLRLFLIVLFPFSCGYALLRWRRRSIQRNLRRQLIASGVPICIRCGYDLRGQEDARCPECGQPFAPALLAHCQLEKESLGD